MRIVLMFEVVALLIVPIVLGYLRKRQMISSKQIALTVITLFSVLMATAPFTSDPYSPFSLPMKDWLRALGVALFFWILGYPVTIWLLRALFDR